MATSSIRYNQSSERFEIKKGGRWLAFIVPTVGQGTPDYTPTQDGQIHVDSDTGTLYGWSSQFDWRAQGELPIQDLITGSIKPAADTPDDLCEIPAERFLRGAPININNLGADTDFSIAVAKEGAVDNELQYICTSKFLAAQDSPTYFVGQVLEPGDVIRVKSRSGDVIFKIQQPLVRS